MNKNAKTLLASLLLACTQLTSQGQSVLINEVITDPQTDWSTNNFDGTDGTGTISNGVDEVVELYILTDGLDLTGWTIELNDSSPITGDLSSSGAFSTSNYIASGIGTFSNTKSGDFLVLGNVTGNGSMNNSITILLKDASNNIVDSVTLGGGADQAPSGNAGTIGDESVQRIPNGSDTNTDHIDFSKGIASLGSENPNQISWDGSASTDWNNAANWASGSLPSANDHVFIPDVTNKPIISMSTSAVTNNLIIDANSSLTIEGGGSLIVHGISSGNVTYNREITHVSDNAQGWYLMSSPLAGITYDNSFADANDIATSGFNRGIAEYTTSANTWSYLQSPSGSISGVSGIGYAMKRGTTTGNISFTGTINTDNVNDVSISTAGDGFNLLGNPYTSYINSQAFLNANSQLAAQIWTWSDATDYYTARIAGDAFILAPGQGFFVKANSGTTVNFAESNQTHIGSDSFQKYSNRIEVRLFLSKGTSKRFAKLYYIDGLSTSFDKGWEGETFGGIPNHLDVYTELVSESQGKKYQIQSLPNLGLENMIVPIGVIADTGNIAFTIETSNLPHGYMVFLEDKVTGNFIRLDDGSAYEITLKNTLNGIGRFFLHTTTNSLSNFDFNLDHVSVYMSQMNSLKIVGIHEGIVIIHLYDMLGKLVSKTTFQANGANHITIPNMRQGLYIVQITSNKGTIRKKIVIK